MSFGEWLTRITAWLAFALWSVVVLRSRHKGRRNAGFLWLVGSIVMLVHVSLAFQFHHQWSHSAAVLETARETEALTGMSWGGGVWLNYLFSTVWIADALWRIAQPLTYAWRPRWLSRSIYVFLTFMWFNATVVFGSRGIQIAGVVVFGCLVVQAWKRWRALRAGHDASQ